MVEHFPSRYFRFSHTVEKWKKRIHFSFVRYRESLLYMANSKFVQLRTLTQLLQEHCSRFSYTGGTELDNTYYFLCPTEYPLNLCKIKIRAEEDLIVRQHPTEHYFPSLTQVGRSWKTLINFFSVRHTES